MPTTLLQFMDTLDNFVDMEVILKALTGSRKLEVEQANRALRNRRIGKGRQKEEMVKKGFYERMKGGKTPFKCQKSGIEYSSFSAKKESEG